MIDLVKLVDDLIREKPDTTIKEYLELVNELLNIANT